MQLRHSQTASRIEIWQNASSRATVKVASRRVRPQSRCSNGFTLIELLVVVAILGVLAGVLLPAVQYAREAARRSSCSNNLRQIGLGLQNFESAQRSYPRGGEPELGHSWSGRLLPYFEQAELRSMMDFKKPWDDAANQPAVSQRVAVFSCPTSFKEYAGATDYCGIAGTFRKTGNSFADGLNGVLFVAGDDRPGSVRMSEILDGLSNTISVGEAVAVTEINHGFWACGWHCLTHDEGGVSNIDGGYNEIASLHPGGANVVFCDGSVQFLDANISGDVISSLCTRAGAEVIGEYK
ncbi:MAG: DUF1559 domain-containing protein [Pirellulaceae bacterium]|nr:DUF1559 domain-containing protein [Pirellulaceae bacterium]